jgi:membrane-associated phospholipid phosphatase
MMERVFEIDRQLFRLINMKWHNAYFDAVMPLLRSSMFWIPLYLFLLVFALMNFSKNKWWWITFGVLTVVLTDFVSSDIIKENFFRLRPCRDAELGSRLIVSYCPQSSSFTSSHATNHFGMATFFFFTLRDYFPKWRYLFYVWAISIVYSQVYVGVHYPFDILFGAITGFVFGYLSARSFNRNYGLA